MMDFDAQKTSDAIQEGERFVQLLHGVEWMTQLSKVALAADQLVRARKDQAAAIDIQAEAAKEEFKKSYAKLTQDLNAQVDALQAKLADLDAQVKAKGAELTALENSAMQAKMQLADDLNNMKAGADAVLGALKAEAEAKAKERDALQAAIDEMRGKIGALA